MNTSRKPPMKKPARPVREDDPNARPPKRHRKYIIPADDVARGNGGPIRDKH